MRKKDCVAKFVKILCIFRVFSLDGDCVSSVVQSVLAAAEAVFSETPVKFHWNFPVHALIGVSGSVSQSLKTRISSDHDMYLPMGYSGSPNGVLSADELKRELAWTYENPWAAGIKDYFPDGSVLVFPSVIDVLRPEADTLYRDYSAGRIHYEDGSANAEGYLIIEKSGVKSEVPCIRIDSTIRIEQTTRHLRRAAASSPLIAYLVEITDPISREQAEKLLKPLASVLADKPEFETALLGTIEHPQGREEPSKSGIIPIPGVFQSPLQRYGEAAPEPKRGRRAGQSNNLMRARLLRRGPHDTPISAPIPEPADKVEDNRTLHAEMPGSVVLPEENYCAHFNAGRFAGFSTSDRKVWVCGEIESYIRIDGRICRTERGGSFSFTTDYARGLHETRTAFLDKDSGEFSTTVEYFFVETSSSLVVNVTADYPRVAPDFVDAYATFDLPIFQIRSAADTINASAFTAEEERRDLVIGPANPVRFLIGKSFSFSREGAGVRIDFTGENPQNEILPIGIRRRGTRLYLYANPRGSYEPTPARRLGGIREEYSLLIRPSFSPDFEESDPARSIATWIPQNRIYIRS